MLSTAELAAIRASVADLLPDTCALLTATETTDSQGGFTVAWGTATASVACRVDPLTQRQGEAIKGASLTPHHAYVLTLPYGTTITEQYRVLHGGVTYAVTSVDNDKSWSASVRAYMERV